MEISSLISSGKTSTLRRAASSPHRLQATEAESSDFFERSHASPIGVVKLPKLEEPRPEDLKRGYLWQAVPLPGPIDAVLGAILSAGPLADWMGLEPAPKGKPEPEALPFSWNSSDEQTFARQMSELEQKIRDPQATEVGKRRIRGGTNANYLVTLSSGASVIWTPKAGEQESGVLRRHIPKGTQSKREEAAYVVDRRLGHLARVPVAVSGTLEGREGSLKLLVSQAQDAKQTDSENGEKPISHSDYRRIALFDHVIGNLDRHSGNYLLDDQGRPVPIDHGLAFPVKNGGQGFSNFHFSASFPLNEKEKSQLRDFLSQRESVSAELDNLLEPDALGAMFERVERMLELGWVSHEWREEGAHSP